MKKRLTKIIISLSLFVLSIIINFDKDIVNNILYVISYIIVGFDVVKKAFRNIFRGKVFDENFLMTVATIGAFFVGEFPEAVAVMLFYQIGELFQSYAVNKSRKSISDLMDIRPDYATININGSYERVNPEDVKIGDVIIVRPGEKIPLDGYLVKGSSTIDTKALTGESLPKEVNENDEILSGSINLNGVIEIKVTKNFSESTVTKILELVENASSNKSKSENFITKFARYYTPLVVIIAAIIAIFPPILFTNTTFFEWLHRALSFLVVSCPCALVISIPLSFFGGIGGASKCGILIKGSNYLEAISKTETVVFDKTGTLTEGVFEVQEIYSSNISQDELLRLATYAESYSNHPISISLRRAYGENIINENTISNVEEIPGFGVSAIIEEKEVLVGNDKLMKKENIEFSKCDKIGTTLYVAIDKEYVGYILIADKIKKDSLFCISSLKKNKVKNTVMLTGDKKNVGEYVAKELGIDTVYSELLPDGKVEKVKELLNKKSNDGKLAFVGDGINDAPVLALADIGIAMGGIGQDAAIEAADIVLMSDEPSKIIQAINISKKTMRIVKENIVFAIFVKVLVLVFSAIGISNMWQAVFADVGVSVIAIINALRVLNVNNERSNINE